MSDHRVDGESLDAAALLTEAVGHFGDGLKLACSFGAEDVVLLDLIAQNKLPISVFVLDTGRLHQETYDLWEQLNQRYGIKIVAYTPQTEPLQQLLQLKGPGSFYHSIENRRECCHLRKVEPLSRALADAAGWITGQRREQSVTRASLPKWETDATHGGIAKLNPLADWTEAQVWDYIKAHRVPYNKLHDQGFPSIGCAPCTRAIEPGEDLRAGRWWWENPEQKECGLHK
ncbi:phosphoadenylyl-sulfate reductase [Armatimonas rosea]|uniref:Adenosine 5'-phosphosulfate reductase n=1 Tax=Armatimonas rosea TaxID=685828 RepID=A0A7W9SNU3_ARMRO|nr:phosphoadenylyl-sulfate reductase [Armatimonas rosea]MBB6049569.1 phosphoadenosine phosphosulfate reductase [Armatimonas rosea]